MKCNKWRINNLRTIYKPLDLLANATICVLLKAMFYLNKKPFVGINSRNINKMKHSAQVSAAAGIHFACIEDFTYCARGAAAPGTGLLCGPRCGCRTAEATGGVREEGRDGCPRRDAPSTASGPACSDAPGLRREWEGAPVRQDPAPWPAPMPPEQGPPLASCPSCLPSMAAP